MAGWRGWAALGAVVIVAMVAGGALAGSANKPAPTADGARLAAVPSEDGPGPREMVEGVAVGFSHDEAGAVAAAMSYARAPQAWLYQSDEQVLVSVSSVATAEGRDELVEDVVPDARVLRDELQEASSTVWFVVSPLATKVEAFDEDRATVRVWTVRVLSAEGVAVPQSGWHTSTFELVWDRGDWRLDSVVESEGPTPQLEAGLQAWEPGYLADELEGFERVGVS